MNWPSRLLLAPYLALAALGISSATPAAEPTDKEQYFIYEINRARNDPAGWAVEMGIDTVTGGDGNPANLVGVAPQPPLAVNEQLVDSARFHSTDMATHHYFGHYSGPTGLWPNQMVRDAGYDLPLQYYYEQFSYYLLPPDSNQVEAIAAGYGPPGSPYDYSLPLNALIGLIVDFGIPDLGHRKHLLGIGEFNEAFREVGTGYAYDGAAGVCAGQPSSLCYFGKNWWSIHTGFEHSGFGDSLDTFVTGVVFSDLNANELYDDGEGLSGVTVAVGEESDTTNAAGGYAIEVSDGTHIVSCSGAGFSGTSAVEVTVAGASREVDFASGEPGAFVDFVAVPEPSMAFAGAAALFTVGAIRRKRCT
ncbi:MAG: hypothetical protein VX574_08480 [Myxococcota bacterium]|nr:hypothetical protein [Myxococcota bacterium]